MKNEYDDFDENEYIGSSGDNYDMMRMGQFNQSTFDRMWKQDEIIRLNREYRESVERQKEEDFDRNENVVVTKKPQAFGGEAEKTLAGKSARNLKKRGLGSRIADFLKNLTKKGKSKEKQENGMQK